MKGVQASGEVPEENLDDVVSKPLLRVALSSPEALQARKSA
jgi:hypothetical protein